ncbi:hypothetical protein [Shimia abyssi]|uniref:Uncharacterized protein n=1 Tax=Shimia abyssi TaxID=1662395 RepID=A0A2P8F8D7_9RHOB|nr:hypothetical protein [Shimia abyssi]PSL17932.1 hypothetical protein CLV88_1133 [Shimia abyssi]
MFKRLVAPALLFGMAATAPPAYAANCAARDIVVERLESKYSEHLLAGGLQQTRNASTVVEVWTSELNGTFTVIVTTPQGISCVVAAGTDWFRAHRVAEVPGTPS